MNTEEDIFEAAAALPPAARAACLDNACAGQPELRARIEVLLRSHDVSGFMEQNVVAADCPKLFAELPEPRPEQCGERMGHYKLLEKIGEGGFGVVWVAEQEQPVRRRVALKIIKPGMDSREVIARFGQERQALAMMDHPNIAKVFDAGATDSGRPYFVMELVRGVKLTEYCDEANLPLAERLRLFIAVCQAVQHAHQKGIIHRDLKPSNILVAPGDDGIPAPKVIDFGVAKAVQQSLTEDTVYTQFEQMIGTPAYMSPEQAGLGPMDIDTRSDVYSLGVLLYELLTGRPPFDSRELLSAGPDEMRRVIREVEPPKPSTRRTQLLNAAALTSENPKSEIRNPKSKIAPDLDWIVMKALEKDRNRRYGTANGLAADIQRFLNDEPVSAGPPGFGYRFRKLIRKHKGPVAAAAAVLATLMGGLTASTVLYLRERAALSRAEAGERAALSESRSNSETASFLAEMLAGVDPYVSAGEDTRLLKKLLEKAFGRVGTELRDQPGVQAHLYSAIGRAYQTIGYYDKAQRCRELTLGICLRLFGPENPSTLASRHQLAETLSYQGKPAEAEAEHRAVLKLQESRLGADHPETLHGRFHFANALLRQGKAAEAEVEYRTVIEARTRVFGAGDVRTLVARSNFSNALDARGKHAEAQSVRREIVRMLESSRGPEDPRTLHERAAAANQLVNLGKDAAAESELREILKIQERQLGPEDPDTLWTRSCLADALGRQEKGAEAEIELREILRIRERILGPDHRETLECRAELANAFRHQKRFAEAEAMIREVIGKQNNLPGPEDPETLDSRLTLGNVLAKSGKYDAAETEFRELLKVRERILGPESTDALNCRDNLGVLLLHRGKLAEAEAEFRSLVEIRERISGPEHARTLEARNTLAVVLLALHKPKESEEESRAVLKLLISTLGADHLATLRCRSALAGALTDQGRYAEAEDERREIVKVRERLLGPDHPKTLRNKSLVAELHGRQAKQAEAEEMLRAVIAAQNKAPGPEHPDTIESRKVLGDLLHVQTKYSDAESEFDAIVEMQKRTKGAEHPETLRSRGLLAAVRRSMGKLVEAEAEFRSIVAIQERVLGVEDPGTLETRARLANTLDKLTKYGESEAEFQAVCELSRRVLGPANPDTLTRRAGYARLLMHRGKYSEADAEFRAVLRLREENNSAGDPDNATLFFNFAQNLQRQGKLEEARAMAQRTANFVRKVVSEGHPYIRDAEQLLRELESGAVTVPDPQHEAGNSRQDAARSIQNAADATERSAEKPHSGVRNTIIAPSSEWKWLHPLNGEDPEKSLPGFHRNFSQPAFDDSKWSSRKDSDDPAGGFGYDLSFAGVDIGKPEEMSHRRTAYFRHTFRTTKAHKNLELRCRRDDGIIVYLDGREIFRDNMEAGPDSYQLAATATVDSADEQAVQRFPVPGVLSPGSHTLAISVHNTAQPSSDLRLGGVTLVELELVQGKK